LTAGERILIVESDPDIVDLISRQALTPLGYKPLIVGNATAALQQARDNPPDLIIANLNLPDLSGKDLLTALSSTGVMVPLVVVAEKGQERGVIQAFRLGAVDALFWPARDAEVVRVVERALQQTRTARAQQKLDRQLEAAQRESERRVRDLTTVLGFSKAVVSMADQRQFFGRLLDGALKLAEADMAWLVVRDDQSKSFLLNAYRNLPAGWARKVNQPLDDGLSSLVSLSGQALTIHGAPLAQFKIAALGKSAAVLPVRVQGQVVGILVVIRSADREFDRNTAAMLEALADFAAISLVHDRLLKGVEGAEAAARRNEQHHKASLEALRASVRDEYRVSLHPLDDVLEAESRALTREQQQAVRTVRKSLERLAHSAETGTSSDSPGFD
jgi:DNA-binding response OmpR family regulator/putative methionine-R-sulfoxide reductase with GAF domain